MCSILGCGFDSTFDLILSFVFIITQFANSIFVIASKLIQVMFLFFNIIEISLYILFNPGLIIMIILTLGNFYAGLGLNRNEIMRRYGDYYVGVAKAIAWFAVNLIQLVMGLIQAIIDII